MLDPFSNYVCSREMAQENSSNADNLTWKLSPKERLWVQAQIVCGCMPISMNLVDMMSKAGDVSQTRLSAKSDNTIQYNRSKKEAQ